jgi:flagellar motor switch protein FliN/FliY
MSAEPLTQAEIDALLKGSPAPKSKTEAAAAPPAPSTISAEEDDAVRRYAEVVALRGAKELSDLLGDKNVSLGVEEITETDPDTVGEQIPGKVVACALSYTGLIHGKTLFAVGYDEALQLAGQITGGGELSTIGDVEETALGQAIHQTVSSADEELSAQLGGETNVAAPGTAIVSDSLAKLLPASDERQILVSYTVQSASLRGMFFQVLPRNLVHGLVEAASESEKPSVAPEAERRYASSTKAPDVLDQPATFQHLISEAPKPDVTNLELILDIPLEIKVELGRTVRKIREVLELGTGSVVELDKLAGEPVDIFVNNKLFARGEVVVIDENFGVRITDILTIEERIEALK